VLGIPHRLFEQAVGHLADQAGVFGDRDEDFGQDHPTLVASKISHAV